MLISRGICALTSPPFPFLGDLYGEDMTDSREDSISSSSRIAISAWWLSSILMDRSSMSSMHSRIGCSLGTWQDSLVTRLAFVLFHLGFILGLLAGALFDLPALLFKGFGNDVSLCCAGFLDQGANLFGKLETQVVEIWILGFILEIGPGPATAARSGHGSA